MLRVGLRLFGSRPYAEVSIRDICTEAGVARPLLQHYFGTKDAFFVAVVAEAMAELERTTRPGENDAPFEGLVANLKAYFSFVVQHPIGPTLVRSDVGGIGASAQALFDAYRNKTFDLIVEAIGPENTTPQAAAAIRCWIGLNETIATQLLDNSTLTVAWAAAFSQKMLLLIMQEAHVEDSSGPSGT